MSEYKIVYSDSHYSMNEEQLIENLEIKVNKMLNEGWTCLGNIVINIGECQVFRFYQTMIKKS